MSDSMCLPLTWLNGHTDNIFTNVGTLESQLENRGREQKTNTEALLFITPPRRDQVATLIQRALVVSLQSALGFS